MSLITAVGLLSTLCINHVAAVCQSYGSDYKDGGKYALDGSVAATFTADEQFTGCTNDTAHNILVDPNGDESECTQVNMQPDGFIQNFDCPAWSYNTMFSGEWSIIVLSNNGDASPVEYQRDFYLSMLDSTAMNPAAPAATTSAAAKRDAPTTFATIVSYSTAPAWMTPSAFSHNPHPTPSAFPYNSHPTPSAFPTEYDHAPTPSGYPNGAPTPSAFEPWKGGVTPSAYAAPTPSVEAQATQCADRNVTGAYSSDFIEAILNGQKPNNEMKKQFVEDRKRAMQSSS